MIRVLIPNMTDEELINLLQSEDFGFELSNLPVNVLDQLYEIYKNLTAKVEIVEEETNSAKVNQLSADKKKTVKRSSHRRRKIKKSRVNNNEQK